MAGVDISPQPNYPFEFHRGDAVEFATAHGDEFDLIHASPPCQAYCSLIRGTLGGRNYEHPRLIGPTRRALDNAGRPYVIENVAGAPIRRDLMLCGEMFGLGVIRHRFFELGAWSAAQPEHVKHRGKVSGWRRGQWFDGPYWAVYGHGGGKGSVAQWKVAMGIDWTNVRREIAEAIPPAYSQYIGEQFLLNGASANETRLAA